jgi:hypothetical protein
VGPAAEIVICAFTITGTQRNAAQIKAAILLRSRRRPAAGLDAKKGCLGEQVDVIGAKANFVWHPISLARRSQRKFRKLQTNFYNSQFVRNDRRGNRRMQVKNPPDFSASVFQRFRVCQRCRFMRA